MEPAAAVANTTSKVVAKGFRDWCFTINNPTEADYVWATQPIFKYIIYGNEVGEICGTPHMQGFCTFKNQKTLSAMKLVHATAHWERRKGTSEQAIEYCKKENKFIETGVPPCSNKEKGERGKEWWMEQVYGVSAQAYHDVDTECLVTHFSGLHKAAALLYPAKLADTTTQHLWYYGDSGSGKSRTAREENPGAYLKMCNKWWDGYTNQEVVIIDDLDKNHAVLCHHLKIWGDRYPFPAEVKGAKLDIRPRLVIVTSNHHPDAIFEGEKYSDADRDAIKRRFKVVKFSIPF